MRSFITITIYPLLFSLICSQTATAGEIDHHGKKVDIYTPDICLSCHELSEEHSHPVNISYPPVGKEKKYGRVSDVQKAGITIVNGKIDCISCHDLNNPDKGHLVVTRNDTFLCLTCHISFKK